MLLLEAQKFEIFEIFALLGGALFVNLMDEFIISMKFTHVFALLGGDPICVPPRCAKILLVKIFKN